MTALPLRARKPAPEADPPLDRTVPFDRLPEFLSPEEFGSYLQLGRNTVYELLRRGEIPHMRWGRLIRIPKTALAMRADDDMG